MYCGKVQSYLCNLMILNVSVFDLFLLLLNCSFVHLCFCLFVLFILFVCLFQPPTIVSNPESSHLDLNASNTHLLHSQLMCWVIGQLNIVWQMRHLVGGYSDGPSEGDKETSLWSPWEHIQPHPKGSPTPVINPSGKYYVRLYWMVCVLLFLTSFSFSFTIICE